MYAYLCSFIVMLAIMFLPWQGDLGAIHQWTLAHPWHAAAIVWSNTLVLFVWGWMRWGDAMAEFDRATGDAA